MYDVFGFIKFCVIRFVKTGIWNLINTGKLEEDARYKW